MKKLTLALLLVTILLSACTKTKLQPDNDAIYGTPVVDNATLSENVVNIKAGTGSYSPKYSDTCATARNKGTYNFNGNSQFQRMMYSNWDKTWAGFPALNRAIGGTTWAEKIKYTQQLITDYKPKIIALYDGENEYSRWTLDTRTASDSILRNFNKALDTIIKQNPQARIVLVSLVTGPIMVQRGFQDDIVKLNAGYKARAAADSNRIKYVDVTDYYVPSQPQRFETDGLHIKLVEYPYLYNKLKAAFKAIEADTVVVTPPPPPPPPTDTVVTPPPFPGNHPPVARAGNDVSVPKAWNYNPWVYGTTSTDPDAGDYIAAFKWDYISGPSQYKIVAPTSGKTRLDSLVIGTYLFKLTVSDKHGALSTDTVQVTITGK